MPITNEYCLIKNGVVINVIVAGADFAVDYADENGFESVQRPSMAVGIDHKYHDGKFWQDVVELDESGNHTGTTHEEEITA